MLLYDTKKGKVVNFDLTFKLTAETEGDLIAWAEDDHRYCIIGSYKDRDIAKKVVDQIVAAYERNEKIFIMPEE